MNKNDSLPVLKCPVCSKAMTVADDRIEPTDMGPYRHVDLECMTCPDVLSVTVEFGLDK